MNDNNFRHPHGHHAHTTPPHVAFLRHGPHPMGPPEAFARFSRGRGRRSKRGDVRAAVLLLLDEQPRNGYQLIQELEQRSNGTWRPSPGSVYPVLSQLEDEGLVVLVGAESGRTYQLTDQGREILAERREAFGCPWDDAAAGVSEPRVELIRSLRSVAAAIRQVMEAGNDDQVRQTVDLIKESRRSIYKILAEDEVEG